MTKKTFNFIMTFFLIGVYGYYHNSKPKNVYEKIHKELKASFADRLRAGLGGDHGSPPSPADTDQYWMNSFLPKCKEKQISYSQCEEGTLAYKKTLAYKEEKERVARQKKALEEKDKKHQEAIRLGYENDPIQIISKELLSLSFGTMTTIRAYLEKQHSIESLNVKYIYADYGDPTFEINESSGTKYLWSLRYPNIDQIRNKDFKEQIVIVPANDASKELYKKITGHKFIDFKNIFECKFMENLDLSPMLYTLLEKNIPFTEERIGSKDKAYYRADINDVVFYGGIIKKYARITAICDFSFIAMGESVKSNFKDVFSSFINIFDSSINASAIYDQCVGDLILGAFKDVNSHKYTKGASRYCDALPGLKVSVSDCGKSEKFECVSGVDMTLSAK